MKLQKGAEFFSDGLGIIFLLTLFNVGTTAKNKTSGFNTAISVRFLFPVSSIVFYPLSGIYKEFIYN